MAVKDFDGQLQDRTPADLERQTRDKPAYLGPSRRARLRKCVTTDFHATGFRCTPRSGSIGTSQPALPAASSVAATQSAAPGVACGHQHRGTRKRGLDGRRRADGRRVPGDELGQAGRVPRLGVTARARASARSQPIWLTFPAPQVHRADRVPRVRAALARMKLSEGLSASPHSNAARASSSSSRAKHRSPLSQRNPTGEKRVRQLSRWAWRTAGRRR